MSLVPPTRDERPQITSYKPGANRGSVSSPGFNHANHNDQAFDIKDFLYAIRQHKILIIVLLLSFTFLSLGGTYFWKSTAPTWTAKAYIQVRVPRETMKEGGVITHASKDQIERLALTKTSFIKSEAIIQAALRSKSVKKTDWLERHPLDTESKLKKNLGVLPVRGTSLVCVSFSDRDPETAAIIANAIMEEALGINKKRDESNSYQRDLATFEQQKQSLTSEIKKVKQEIKLMRDNIALSATKDSLEALKIELVSLSSRAARAQSNAQQAYQLYESVKNLSEEELENHPAIQQALLGDVELQEARSVRDNMLRALKSDEQRYGPEHKIRKNSQHNYDVAEADYNKKNGVALKKAISGLLKAREEDFKSMNHDYSVIQSQINVKNAKIKAAKNDEAKLEEEEKKEEELRKDLKDNAVRISNIRMLMENEETMRLHANAEIPRQPSWPRYSVLVPIGVFLGLAFGVGIAVLLELIDNSVKNPNDIGRKINLPMLGMIPHSQDVYEHIYDLRLAFLKHPDTIIDEAFRQVRTNLMFSGFAEHRRSLLVTSAQPEDGRTSVALNLGNVMAKNGQRVLVIDANFRQPCFNELFPNVPKAGLSGTIMHHLDWRKQLTRVESNMYVMSAGQRPKNPAELLGSETMRELLDELYDHFDQIIFDGAPCMVVSDSLILSTIVDGTVCVVRASENSTGIVLRMRNMLEKVGSHIYGVVLNGVRVTAGGYLRKNYETFYEYQESLALEHKTIGKSQEASNHAQLPANSNKFAQDTGSLDIDIIEGTAKSQPVVPNESEDQPFDRDDAGNTFVEPLPDEE